ncbi:MAG: YlxR family protein [Galbitalea sp.]
MEPVRTCLGCRSRADRSSLLRVVARDGVVIPDPSAILPGRGAWVHPTPACVDKSTARNALGRALRVGGALDTGQLLAAVSNSDATEQPATQNTLAGAQSVSPTEQAD